MKNKSVKYILLSVAITSSLLFTACGHKHTFSEATCTTPKTCTECQETEGEALGHTFTEATCKNPKTCSVCNTTEGSPLEHAWLKATTEAPKTCEACGLTDGGPLIVETAEQESADKAKQEAISGEDNQQAQNQETSSGSSPVMVDSSQYSGKTKTAIDNANELLEDGLITEQRYKDLIASLIDAKELSNNNRIELSPESMAELRATSTDGTGDPRTNIEYGTGDYTGLEDIRMN